jgi:hypothetical protein
MAGYVPPGWPVGVHPPGSERFEKTAVTWLLDVVPADYRVHGVLLRHPAALAALARHHLAACVQGAREGYRSARSELSAQLPQPGVEAVLAAYRAEGGRLVKTEQAVDLVARALSGEVFAPRPQRRPGPPEPGPQGPGGRTGQPALPGRTVSSGARSPGANAASAGANAAPLSRGRDSSRQQAHSPVPAGPSGTTPPSPPARRSRPRQTRARPAAEARAR